MMEVIPKSWNVPEAFRARFGEKAGRQRLMVAGLDLLLVLHEVPKEGDSTRVAKLFWRDARGEWHSGRAETGIFHLRTHVDAFVVVARRLEVACDSAALAEAYFRILKEAVPLLRCVRHQYRVLQEAREAAPNDRELIALRDEAGETERMLELVVSEAQCGLDFTVARRSEEFAQTSHDLAAASHRLNRLAALFLPATALASLFGMNLVSGLEDRFAPALFWLVLMIGVAVGWLLHSRMGGSK